MVTAAEVDALVESGVSITSKYTSNVYDIDNWDELKYELPRDGVVTPLGVLFKQEEFGGMDQGSEYWVVVGIILKDGRVQYFKKDGWYASHVGSELDGDTYEVEPFERTVTNYRALTRP